MIKRLTTIVKEYQTPKSNNNKSSKKMYTNEIWLKQKCYKLRRDNIKFKKYKRKLVFVLIF